MQPIRQLARILENLADSEHCLFSLQDLRAAVPGQSMASFKALVGRAQKNNLLRGVCRGIYLYPKVNYPSGLILYHTAARLRAHEFNYISLESALSDAGVISQIPLNWITLISSGRSHIVDCGTFGHIEFIHTKRSLESVASQLSYDPSCRLWRASVALALKDMALTRRNMDLVNMELAHELI